MTLSLILTAIAVAAGQGQAEPMTADVCMGFFRDTKRAMAIADVNRCAELIAHSDDEASHAELIELAFSWARYLDTTVKDRVELARDRQASRKKTLLYAVVGHGLEPLCRDPDLAPEILKLLTSVLTTTEHSINAPAQFYELLGQLNVPEDSRHDAVLEILDHWSKAPQLRPAWLGMIKPSYYPDLVARVEESDNPETFHFCAAAALAHFGYQGILPRLESLRPSFRAKHSNIEGHLIHFAWQIETQNPPEKLIAYIGSKPGVRIEERLWAVGRAVKLGLPREDIRNAILAYVGQVTPDERGFRRGATSLKEVGIASGVLSSNDLPEIRLDREARRKR